MLLCLRQCTGPPELCAVDLMSGPIAGTADFNQELHAAHGSERQLLTILARLMLRREVRSRPCRSLLCNECVTHEG